MDWLVFLVFGLAVLSVGVVYGTDVFFAVVGRPALERSGESGLVDVMGRLHEVGDARMPVFGALGLASTLALTITLWTQTGWLGLVALMAQAAHLAIYQGVAKPVNAMLVEAAQSGQMPNDARALQRRWDGVIGLRAALLSVALVLLVAAAFWR